MDFVGWVSVTSAVIFGVVGMVTGIGGLFQSRKANEIAESANRVARGGVVVGEQGNGIAQESNDIGRDSNAIGGRSLTVALDQTRYNWSIGFDKKGSAVDVLNDCPFSASDVTVVIRYQNRTVVEKHARSVPAFKKVVLESEFFAKKIGEDRAAFESWSSTMDEILEPLGPPGILVDVYVAWTKESGMRVNQTGQNRLS
ncbi:MAG: hypothetical protein ABF408_08795 [Bifidobacterium aquikefiri]